MAGLSMYPSLWDQGSMSPSLDTMSSGFTNSANTFNNTSLTSSGGSGSFLTRTTAILATLFFLISLVLGSMSSNKVKQGSEWENLQQTQQVEQSKAPVKKDTDVPE